MIGRIVLILLFLGLIGLALWTMIGFERKNRQS